MGARRSRGRPRAFEPSEALESALAAFRRHGYSGTSLADLTAATGLNRPSLYATFGNKRALFEASVDHYWAHVTSVCLPALRGGPDLRSDLRAFLTRFIEVFADEEPGGCIVACGLPAEVDREPALREKLAGILRVSDRAVAARLREAQAAGELAPDADPARLGALIVSHMTALSLRSRAGATRAELERQAECLVELVVGTWS